MLGLVRHRELSLPDRAVAVGVPAKIVSYAGSFDFVTYTGMEQDPARQASLKLASSEQVSDPRASE